MTVHSFGCRLGPPNLRGNGAWLQATGRACRQRIRRRLSAANVLHLNQLVSQHDLRQAEGGRLNRL